MFDGKRYTTQGIKKQVSEELQIILWSMIGKIREKEIETDHLQVFNLDFKEYNDKVVQYIEHVQESPEYKRTTELFLSDGTRGRVFIISDKDQNGEEYSTMMLADER